MSTLDEAFEFVLVNSSTLPGLTAEKHFFEKYFSGESVVSFPNLGGDAQLIVPTDKSADNNYTHLATFVRNAAPEQVDKFWQVVAEIYRKSISETPKWLSTSGLGVYWLHVRIDTRPKYYQYLKYKQIT